MTLYLVRHGLAEAGAEHLDPGLAPTGHAQAKATAEALRGLNAGRLIVSPLRRTQETAAPIAEVLGLAPELREEVAEVFDPAMPAAERRAMFGPFMAGKWSDQPEPLRQWRARVVRTLVEIGVAAELEDRSVVVVSHYIAIGAAIGYALGDDRVVPLPIANCSVTTLAPGGSVITGLKLLVPASTAHLEGELVTGLRTALPGGP